MDDQASTGPEFAESGENINLHHYWHVILERRWLVITAFISVFVLSLIYIAKAPRIFQGVARIQIDREQDNILSIRDVLSVDGRDQNYWQTQYKNLQSRTLIESVIRQLRLDKDPRYSNKVDVVRAVLDDITIVPIRLSWLVDIKVEHTDPHTATNIANTLVETFLQNNLDKKRDKLRAASEYLAEEEKVLAKEVETADKALQTYRKDKKMISLDESENIFLQALKQAQNDLVKAQGEATVAQTYSESAQRLVASGASKDSIPEVVTNPYIQKLHAELILVEADLAELLTRYKDKWPAVIQRREKVAKLKDAIKVESEKIYQSILARAEMAKTTEQRMRENVQAREKDQFSLGELRIDYDVLNRKAESKKLLYNLVLQRMKETDLTQKDKTQNMQVVDYAKEPRKAIKPRIVLTLIMGVLGGLAVAIGLAFFVNYLDDSIKIQDDVETYLRLGFLGYIPNIKTTSLIERDLQAHLHPRSNAAEGFRTIRASISLMPKAEKFKVLAVTSTIPSEGKSLVAANLAVVFAQTGMKTLLIDADLRRPSVHKAFQLHSPAGLSAFLMGENDNLPALINNTDVPQLDVVCCGAIPSSPSELIGSNRMAQFLQEVRLRYDRIIVDCPPVSAVSDPLVLAARSDGVVFVTKFNKIRRQHARRTVQRIQDAGIHILGVILNDIDFEGKDSYYYSYYYYQNRYYASHYKTDADGRAKAAGDKVKKEKTPA